MADEYASLMPTVADIEQSIASLPPKDFFTLAGWMADRHLEILAAQDFESTELESELLKAVDSPRFVVNEKLMDEIRRDADAGR